MSIKTRLAKLEASKVVDSQPAQLAIFFEAPGIEPIGYTCDGIEIIRELSESIETLQKRCSEALSWPNESFSRHHFIPFDKTIRAG